MANKKAAKLGSLTRTFLSTAKDMYAGGVMSKRAHQKITLRHLGGAAQPAAKPLTGKQMRALRDRENISQAVLAHHLHVTVGYVSQLERDEKRLIPGLEISLNSPEEHGSSVR